MRGKEDNVYNRKTGKWAKNQSIMPYWASFCLWPNKDYKQDDGGWDDEIVLKQKTEFRVAE